MVCVVRGWIGMVVDICCGGAVVSLNMLDINEHIFHVYSFCKVRSWK